MGGGQGSERLPQAASEDADREKLRQKEVRGGRAGPPKAQTMRSISQKAVGQAWGG